MSHKFDDQMGSAKVAKEARGSVLSDLAQVKINLEVPPTTVAGDMQRKALARVDEDRAELIKTTVEKETGQYTEPPPATPPAPSTPLLPQQLGPFVLEPIHFPGDIPVKVYENQLTLYRDGGYGFRGRFHKAGAGHYDTAISWVIFGASRTAYSFSHAGHLGWFDENDAWNYSDRRDELAAAYVDLANGDRAGWCRAGVGWDVVALVGEIVRSVHPAAPIIDILG